MDGNWPVKDDTNNTFSLYARSFLSEMMEFVGSIHYINIHYIRHCCREFLLPKNIE